MDESHALAPQYPPAAGRASTTALRPDRSPVSHHAAELIQQQILNGVLRAGDRLPSQRDLADKLGLSRNSLREALSALETLGYLRIEPGRGVYVLSEEERQRQAQRDRRTAGKYDLKDIYEIRYALEGTAATLLASCITSDQLEALRQLALSMRGAALRHDMVNLSESYLAFYRHLLRWSGNRIAADAGDRLVTELERSIQSTFADQRFGSITGSMEEIDAIIQALAKADSSNARKAVETHILYSAERAGVALGLTR